LINNKKHITITIKMSRTNEMNAPTQWIVGEEGQAIEATGALRTFLILLNIKIKREGYIPDITMPMEYQDNTNVPVADIIAHVNALF